MATGMKVGRRHGAMRSRVLAVFVVVVSALATSLLSGAAGARTPTTHTYYVSLGDSYAVGYQPTLGATPGYAGYVAARTHLTLVNFGCAGATTTSILNNFDDGNPNLGVPDASVTIALLGASLAGIEAFRRKLQSCCAR